MNISNINFDTIALEQFTSILKDFENSYVIFEKESQLVCKLLSELKEISQYDIKSFVPQVNNYSLGNRRFCELFSVSMPIMSGSMANEIASTDLVINMANNQLLASYGTAGISITRMRKGIDTIKKQIGNKSFACCLIHHPLDLSHEEKIVQLFIDSEVNVIEASAFMKITPAIVMYRAKGLTKRDNQIYKKNKIIAKISRPEIAENFLIPPSLLILENLRDRKLITQVEFELAQQIPLCDALTVEADSGGHTDNRPAQVILPAIIKLRQRLCMKYRKNDIPLIGQAGGIASPVSVLSAFSLGADYVVTGSINQSTVEAGTSKTVKELLANTAYYDVQMAPSGDMFEQGVKVQVLKKGTLYPTKSSYLFEVYKKFNSIEELPAPVIKKIENWIFQKKLSEVQHETIEFYRNQNLDHHLEKAKENKKYMMAMIFKWYVGQASRWAVADVADRCSDYQIWCGPAMGGFNAWSKGTDLEKWENRNVSRINIELFNGALFELRKHFAKVAGVILEVVDK